MFPLVSVIIPAYNSSEFIQQTINSVLAQTYQSIEIIVVDDGSKDNTLELLQTFEPEGVKVLRNNKKGACAARNFGFFQSRGEFIQFLDADDPIAPDKIEKQLNQLLSHSDFESKLIHCQWLRFTDTVNNIYYWGPEEAIAKDLKPIDWLVANKMSMTGCWLTHRSIIEKGGLWNENLKKNQDGEFFSRLMLHVNEVLFCKEAIVYYRSGNLNSISNMLTRGAVESQLNSLELIESYMLRLENSKRVKLSIANRYQRFLFGNYIPNPDLALLAESKIKDLGGSDLQFSGGVMLRLLSKLIGWKRAILLKEYVLSLTGKKIN